MVQGLQLRQGDTVVCAEKRYILAAPRPLTPTTVLAREEQTGQITVLNITELLDPAPLVPVASVPDLATIPDQQWKDVTEPRLRVINAVKNSPQGKPIKAVLEPVLEALAAEGHAISLDTAYRWVRHQAQGREVLVPAGRSDRGARRLHPNAETIIEYVIEKHLFAMPAAVQLPEGAEQLDLPGRTPGRRGRKQGPQRRMKIAAAIDTILNMCRAAGLTGHELPHPNTIRARISEQKQKRRVDFARAQQGKDAARALQAAGAPHLVLRPNEEWQCDHTRMGIQIVHRLTREPIGRATITFISDVCTRVVLSWYITFEAPSVTTVGIALTRAILPKDELRVHYNLSKPWNVWGKPVNLVVDNAREFRSHSLKMFCALHGITLVFRPVGRPEYGGHIERVVGTFETRIKSWFGATGSNPKDRDDYDAEANAIYDLDQLDAKIALEVEQYNNSFHRGLQGVPLETYERLVFGEDGIGPGELFTGEAAQRLRIDGLPHKSVHPTVQRDGITWDNITYFSGLLRPLIKNGQTYVVRRDPRDISKIYLWLGDGQTGKHYAINYRDPSHPPISVWELKAARQKLKDQAKVVDEAHLMATARAQLAIDKQALAQRQAARATPRGARKVTPDDKRLQRNDERREYNSAVFPRVDTPADTFTGAADLTGFPSVDPDSIQTVSDTLNDD